MKKILFALLFLAPAVARADSIALDTSTTSGAFIAAGSITPSWNHITGSGSNRVMIVGFSYSKNPLPNVSSITVCGTPMTRVQRLVDNTNFLASEQWFLVAPTVGVCKVQVNIGVTAWNGGGGSVSFFNVDQSSPPVEVSSGAVTTPTNAVAISSVTTVTDGAWLVDATMLNANRTETVDGRQTEVYQNPDPGDGLRTMGSVRGPISPPGLASERYSFTATAWQMAILAIKPYIPTFGTLTIQ